MKIIQKYQDKGEECQTKKICEGNQELTCLPIHHLVATLKWALVSKAPTQLNMKPLVHPPQ